MEQFEENPFQTPSAASESAQGQSATELTRPLSELRAIARYQRGIIQVILAYLVLGICAAVIGPQIPVVLLAARVLALVVVFVGLIFVVLLASKVYSLGVSILFAVLSIVPCLNLLVLLVLSSKATAELRENNIHVGFLGARMSDIQ
ncbi:MAG: hypothetical protein DWQ42_01570 [Planctomycetota bacterium]|nr:MAG: hypothetical protein DWQ42_01570 [Planctomycetota bacterium]REK44238.1 MAG: hypothetical protein DWQ46_10435 [Planctomycetota bacterium]